MTESNPSWMEKVEQMAQAVAADLGCILYDIEFVGIGKGRTLRVFIDKEKKSSQSSTVVEGEESTGANVEDCSNVSRALDAALDEKDIIPGETYYLEVSTPGLDRWLRKPWHFEKAVGRKIWVKTRGAFENYGVTDSKLKAAKQIEDVLKGFDGENLVFQVKDKVKDVDVKIPFSAIEKSKIVFQITKGQKK
jgi:ribosome maturation factor RimP